MALIMITRLCRFNSPLVLNNASATITHFSDLLDQKMIRCLSTAVTDVERIVPDDLLQWESRAYFSAARHVPHRPQQNLVGEYKVKLQVNVNDLKLSPKEQNRLAILAEKRYNKNKQILTLNANKFPNRLENKRYLVHVLEKLMRETKK